MTRLVVILILTLGCQTTYTKYDIKDVLYPPHSMHDCLNKNAPRFEYKLDFDEQIELHSLVTKACLRDKSVDYFFKEIAYE